jgi:hypothetical protein
MEYRNRWLEVKVLDLFAHFPVVAVLGARQAGKSTLVEHLPIEGLSTVVFDPVQDIERAREDPDFFLQNHPPPLFLDEVQYAPEVLAAIKRKVDREKRKALYLLSGSQNLAVLESVSESLAGRVAVLELRPMGRAEIEGRTPEPGFLRRFLFPEPGWNPLDHACAPPPSASRAMWRGGFPGLLELPDRLYQEYFASYRQTYIERDVRTAGDVGDVQTFGRFFGLLAALTACEVNAQQLGRELGVDRKTAKRWIGIAGATYQWTEIPAYSHNAVKRAAGKTKGYLSDTGLACHLQRIASPDVVAQHPLRGQLFETYVVLEILKRIETWPARPSLHHFRSYNGAEVDLILEIDGRLHPVEIRMTSRPQTKDCSGFLAFRRCFPAARIGPALLVCSCERVQRVREDVLAVPWWEL